MSEIKEEYYLKEKYDLEEILNPLYNTKQKYYEWCTKRGIHDKSVPVRDTYQQLKTAQKKKDEVVQYKLGDAVTHPKFGHGIVEKINQRSGGVHLHIRFDGEVKCIDQKWLSRKKYM